MSRKYLILISIFLVLVACSKDENKKNDTGPKSYEPKNTHNAVGDESLPEEKIEVNLKTPEPVPNPTFRKVKWGMSKEEVKSRESGPIVTETETIIGYDNIQVGGLDTYVGYVFVENKLYRGVYAFKEDYVNEDRYITEYNNLKDILITKYGTPEKDQKIWLDDSDYYKNRLGDAVAMSKLIYYAEWSTNDTHITLSLMGEKYQPMLKIEYDSTDPELQKLLDKAKQNEIESDF